MKTKSVLLSIVSLFSIISVLFVAQGFLFKYVRYDYDSAIQVGELKIVSYSKVFDSAQTALLLEALPEELKELNVDIYIMGSKVDKFRYLNLITNSGGYFNSKNNLIVIFEESFFKQAKVAHKENPETYGKLYTLFGLVHELRHKKQQEIGMTEKSTRKLSYYFFKDKYNEDPLEIDANDYVINLLNGETGDRVAHMLNLESIRMTKK